MDNKWFINTPLGPIPGAGSGTPSNVQLFTSSGTWTKMADNQGIFRVALLGVSYYV